MRGFLFCFVLCVCGLLCLWGSFVSWVLYLGLLGCSCFGFGFWFWVAFCVSFDFFVCGDFVVVCGGVLVALIFF